LNEKTLNAIIALIALVVGGVGGGVGTSGWLESQYEEQKAELEALRNQHLEYVRSSNEDLEDCRAICVAREDRRGILFRSAPAAEAMPDVAAPPPESE
jgi:hypothetical protein